MVAAGAVKAAWAAGAVIVYAGRQPSPPSSGILPPFPGPPLARCPPPPPASCPPAGTPTASSASTASAPPSCTPRRHSRPLVRNEESAHWTHAPPTAPAADLYICTMASMRRLLRCPRPSTWPYPLPPSGYGERATGECWVAALCVSVHSLQVRAFINETEKRPACKPPSGERTT